MTPATMRGRSTWRSRRQGYEELRREQRARRERGDRVQLGIGVCTYVEMTAVLNTTEFGEARAEPDGSIVIAVGTTASGQGHETAYAQLASRLLGVPMDLVRVVQSDTGAVARGSGTSGSRSLQLGGSAVRGSLRCADREGEGGGGAAAGGERGGHRAHA